MDRAFRGTVLSRWQSSTGFRVTNAFACLLLLNTLAASAAPVPGDKPSTYPDWWFQQGVIPRLDPNSNTPPLWNQDYATPDDYAAANIGQLKYFATKAAAEFNLHLPGGAGAEVNNLVAQWSQPPAAGVVRDDFAAVNLGQLKSVASVFYDRLIAVRYTSAYPWVTSGQSPDDYAMANLGQIKYLFSFELTKSTLNDGLPDWWVLGWNLGSVTDPSVAGADPDGDGFTNLQEFQNGTDPTDFYNGQAVVMTLVSGDAQSALPGAYLPNPIVVALTKSDGTPWSGAPVTFSADAGLGMFATASDGSATPAASVQVKTGSDGKAQIYFQPAASIQGHGYASAGTGQVTFAASGYDSNSAPSGTNVLQTASSGNNQTTLSWSSNSTNSTGTVVQRWTYGTGWVTLANVPAGTNNYTDTSTPSGGIVAYRTADSNSSGQSSYSSTQSANGQDLTKQDSDHDGLSDAEEIAIGSNPNQADTDGDGVIDGRDLDPLDPAIKLPRVAKTSYAAIDLTALGVSDAAAINDSLQILDRNGCLWTNFKSKTLPTPPIPAFSSGSASWVLGQGSGIGTINRIPSISTMGQIPYEADIVWDDYGPGGMLWDKSGAWGALAGVWSITSGFTTLNYTPEEDSLIQYIRPGYITPGGIIIGSYTDGGYIRAGLVWLGGGEATVIGDTATGYPDMGSQVQGTEFVPIGANDTGTVVGYTVQPDSPHYNRAAIWQGGTPQTLSSNTSPYGDSVQSVNNSNPPIAVGVLNKNDVQVPTMWVSRGGSNNWMQKPIGTWDIGKDKTAQVQGSPWQINDRCEIIGVFYDDAYNELGTLWQNGQVVNLEKRAPASYTGYYPYCINNKGAMLAWATRQADGQDVQVLLVPVELMVDGNRDGSMSVDDASVHNMDGVASDRPYRFWINNDQDNNPQVVYPDANDYDLGRGVTAFWEGETVPATEPDFKSEYIKTKRDLEDWARMWIDARSIAKALGNSSQLSVALQFLPPDGGSWPNGSRPSIKMCKAYETDGGRQYLRDDQTAGNQISGEYDVPIESKSGETIIGTSPFYLPADFFQDQDADDAKHFIFEGVTEGKGKLVMSFYLGQQKIGESAGLYVDLKNVRKMFRRGKVSPPYDDPKSIPDPWSGQPVPSLSWVADDLSNPFEADPDEVKECIIYVHGWRMSYWESINWAETTFKRLWHQGFKGRFASFRWPTFSDGSNPNTNGYFTYNSSEYRAWMSGPMVSAFASSLPGDYRKLVMAHSMGNVVMGSALRSGLAPERYVLLNGAMAAMAYDSTIVDYPSFVTPDTDRDPATAAFGLSAKVQSAVSGSKLISFGLFEDTAEPNDFALGLWELNNSLNKPQSWFVHAYRYLAQNDTAPKLWYGMVEPRGHPFYPDRAVTYLPEAMGYVTQSRSHAVGSDGRTGGCISDKKDLHDYSFGTEHSAEWNRSIQETFNFWSDLTTQLKITQ